MITAVYRLYFVAYLIGGTLFFAFVGLGMYRSITVDHQLPNFRTGYQKEIGNLLKQQDYDGAIVQLRLAAELDPAYRRDLLVELAKIARSRQDFDTQVFALRRLVAMNVVYNGDVYYSLAMALMSRPQSQREELLEAARHLESLLELRPDSLAANSRLGRARLLLGDHEQAEVCFRKALQIDPHDPEARQGLQYVLRGQQDP